MRTQYSKEDLGQGIRGKYLKAYRKGTNVILLQPDVAEVFSSAEAVNTALRSLMNVAQKSVHAVKRVH